MAYIFLSVIEGKFRAIQKQSQNMADYLVNIILSGMFERPNILGSLHTN